MARESALWKMARENLKLYGMFRRLENAVGSGDPDVLYTLRCKDRTQSRQGLIELKHETKWPVQLATPLRLPHLTQQQEEWHDAWRLHGGTSWVLLQVAHDYMLFESRHIKAIREGLCRDELWQKAKVGATNSFPTAQIIKCLRQE